MNTDKLYELYTSTYDFVGISAKKSDYKYMGDFLIDAIKHLGSLDSDGEDSPFIKYVKGHRIVKARHIKKEYQHLYESTFYIGGSIQDEHIEKEEAHYFLEVDY